MDKIHYSIIRNAKELEILRNKSSFNYTYDETTITLLKKNFTLADSLSILAKNNDEFAAFCSIDRDWWEENYFFIREILVDPKFQKQGIGEKIMDMCREHAREKKAIGVVTETDFKNFPMQKLCTKFGFQEWENPQWKEGITYKLIF
ncbi:GNAT family N-acetyltransferase [Candidatus Peregrinibacteria bacterium]|nr:GNAT family N-acetyltransferase [Candidatus Peregrinibacteria bacterium]